MLLLLLLLSSLLLLLLLCCRRCCCYCCRRCSCYCHCCWCYCVYAIVAAVVVCCCCNRFCCCCYCWCCHHSYSCCCCLPFCCVVWTCQKIEVLERDAYFLLQLCNRVTWVNESCSCFTFKRFQRFLGFRISANVMSSLIRVVALWTELVDWQTCSLPSSQSWLWSLPHFRQIGSQAVSL